MCKKINRIDNFKRHVAICDGEKKDLECHNCGAVFKRKFNLDRHKETCKNELICKTCGKTYQRQDKFDEHVAKCQGIKLKIPFDKKKTGRRNVNSGAKKNPSDYLPSPVKVLPELENDVFLYSLLYKYFVQENKDKRFCSSPSIDGVS